MRSIKIVSRLEKNDRFAFKSDIAPAVNLLKSVDTTGFFRIELTGIYKNIDLLLIQVIVQKLESLRSIV